MAQEDSNIVENLESKWDSGRKKDLCASLLREKEKSSQRNPITTTEVEKGTVESGGGRVDSGVNKSPWLLSALNLGGLIAEEKLTKLEARLEPPHTPGAIGEGVKVHQLGGDLAMVTPRLETMWTHPKWEIKEESLVEGKQQGELGEPPQKNLL